MKPKTEESIDSDLFGDEEKDILKYSIGVRLKMAKNNEDNVSTNSDIRTMNELLNGLDNSILALAKLDQDAKKHKNTMGIQSDLLEAMKMRRGKPNTDTRRQIYLDDTVYKGEILDSEMRESGEVLEPSDFIEEIE